MLSSMTSELLFRLYKRKIWRKFIVAMLIRYDGGQTKSLNLRRIFLHYHRIEIGAYSYGGCFNPVRIAPGTKIGKFCSFASCVYVFAANHKLNAVTTHPFIYNPIMGVVKNDLREIHNMEFGNDIWVGENVIFTAGACKVGNGAVIGAGAVVTREVPPYAVVVGSPAKIIKFRFHEDVINQLQAIQWWNWEPADIFRMHTEFNSVEVFLEKAREKGFTPRLAELNKDG